MFAIFSKVKVKIWMEHLPLSCHFSVIPIHFSTMILFLDWNASKQNSCVFYQTWRKRKSPGCPGEGARCQGTEDRWGQKHYHGNRRWAAKRVWPSRLDRGRLRRHRLQTERESLWTHPWRNVLWMPTNDDSICFNLLKWWPTPNTWSPPSWMFCFHPSARLHKNNERDFNKTWWEGGKWAIEWPVEFCPGSGIRGTYRNFFFYNYYLYDLWYSDIQSFFLCHNEICFKEPFDNPRFCLCWFKLY